MTETEGSKLESHELTEPILSDFELKFKSAPLPLKPNKP